MSTISALQKDTAFPYLNKAFKFVKTQPLYTAFIGNFNGHRGMIMVNESAAKILSLCDGKTKVLNIKSELTEYYKEDYNRVSALVDNFIDSFSTLGYIDLLLEETQRDSLVFIGSSTYWTPNVIAIELTEACPLRCKHCYLDAGNGVTMPYQDVCKILDEVKGFALEHIQLTGGEPLLHPNFFEILERTIALGGDIHVFTSGYINNRATVEKLKAYAKENITLQVSLDGMESYHDAFRGVNGCFQKTVSFIREMVAAGYRVIIGMCIDEQDYDEVKRVCRMVKKIGAVGLRLGAISDRGRAEDTLATNVEKMKQIKSLQQKISSEEDSEAFKIIYASDEQKMRDSEYGHNCGMGQTIVKISPTGDISPCLMSEIVVGNALSDSIKSAQLKYSRIFENIHIPSVTFCSGCQNEILCANCINEALLHKKAIKDCRWCDEQKQALSKLQR